MCVRKVLGLRLLGLRRDTLDRPALNSLRHDLERLHLLDTLNGWERLLHNLSGLRNGLRLRLGELQWLWLV